MSVAIAVGPLDAACTSGPSPTAAPRCGDAAIALPPVALEHGGQLTEGRLAVRTLGDPSHPAVVVMGGISAGRDVAPLQAGEGGWWPEIVGVGCPIDPREFHVVAFDWLAGRGASTPARALPHNRNGIPALTPRDQADALAALLDALGIHRVHACVGASYGGMVALAFGARHCRRAERLIVLGAAHEPHPMATALRVVQREIVIQGLAGGNARSALVLARGLGLVTYRSALEFANRFAPAPDAGCAFPVERYLRARGEAFADAFTPDSFLCLSQSIDLHRVDPTAIRAPVTLIAFEPDAIAPAWQVRSLANQLTAPWVLRVVRSLYGHDAFLKDTPAFAQTLTDALRRPEVSR